MNEMKILSSTHRFRIRFSEVDAMRVVWHGSYVKYLEDAREYFGQEFGFGYEYIVNQGYVVPIVDLSIQYKEPITYGMEPEITIIYRPTVAAKIIFDYEIRDSKDKSLKATAHSVQVFLDSKNDLVLYSPSFYDEWKKSKGVYTEHF
jgi:acyl-CoA thioester hydrolase